MWTLWNDWSGYIPFNKKPQLGSDSGPGAHPSPTQALKETGLQFCTHSEGRMEGGAGQQLFPHLTPLRLRGS